ncbi:alpha actinin [Pelomyxa schiedti]|nr:alpha actinin [Pelomyxa schiedti]
MAAQAAVALQKKIFSRWVSQKISRVTGKAIDDCVKAMTDGLTLIALLEALSEKKCTARLVKAPKMRPQVLENATAAIAFAKECGVQLRLWPSNSDLVDGVEQQVLGLIWGIMQRFMKFTDEEGHGADLNAKDALMTWCQNTTRGYPDVHLDNWKTSWHDGMALCAIIHKYRPSLINWESLERTNKKVNIQAAMHAAHKYFMLEQYITPDEFLKLDDNSMVVYVSEYYYGISEQRKLDLAGRRISKVIKLTKDNDALRATYEARSEELLQRISQAGSALSDYTIDNTMEGAKTRLNKFYDYKMAEKSDIMIAQLDLEALFNTIATILTHNHRPEFVPHHKLCDIANAMAGLEEVEQKKKVALHAELNRQLKLQKLNEHHEKRTNKIEAWISAKQEYLSTPPPVTSASTAQLQLRLLKAFDQELAQIGTTHVTPLVKLGKELAAGKYQNLKDVTIREQRVEQGLQDLKLTSAALLPVLNDLCAIYDYQQWVKDTLAGMEDLLFGFTLEEVLAFEKSLSDLSSTYTKDSKAKMSAFKDYEAHMDSVPTLDPDYKAGVIGLVESITNELEGGIQSTKAIYEAELELQKQKDRKCKAFADLVEPLVAMITANKAKITAPGLTFETQLALVEERIAALDDDGASLPEIAAAFTELEESGITNITHTSVTLRDAELMWQQWQSFLTKKKAMLMEEIARSATFGVTPAQIEEIQSTFTQFDRNQSGMLDMKELRACLYSLGEEKTSKEIEQIMTEYGSADGMSLDNFKQFMISHLAVSDTRDDILASFRQISRSDVSTTVKHDYLEAVIPPQDMQYIKETAKLTAKSGEYDYVEWTNTPTNFALVTNSPRQPKMFLMFCDACQKYTLKRICDLCHAPTRSAHPARFSPEDKFSKARVTIKRRYGILPTQLPQQAI